MSAEFWSKITAIERQLPAVIRRLPEIAKVEGLRFIANNFRAQGFEKKPGQVDKWKPKKQGSKPVLIGEKRGGTLRRSWTGTAGNGQTVFQSNMPYAGVHNEGLRAGRPPGFIMPERRMIGPSEALDKAIEKKLDTLIDNIL